MHFKLEDFLKEHKNFVKKDNNNIDTNRKSRGKQCTDHLGNVFNSYKEMAKFHKVDPYVFYMRKNRYKLPIELCLSRKSLRNHRYAKGYLQGEHI